MKDLVILLILILIVGGAALYIYKAKKNGQKCIGCPYAKECRKKVCGTDLTNNEE